MLDVVVAQNAIIFQWLVIKKENLLVWRKPQYLLNSRLHTVNGILWFNFQLDRFTSHCLHGNGHGWLLRQPKSNNQMHRRVKGRFLVDAIVAQCAVVFEFLPTKDQTLLARWKPLRLRNFNLHLLNRIPWFDF